MSGTAPFPTMLSASTFDPADWYWYIADDATRVWSSRRAAYYSLTDADYQTWLTKNAKATAIASTSDLLDILISLWMPIYLAAGMQVESTATPALNGTYPLDQTSQSQVTGVATSIAAGRGLPGGSSTFNYQSHVFNEVNFLNFADACSNFVYLSYQALGRSVMTGSGSMPEQPVVIA